MSPDRHMFPGRQKLPSDENHSSSTYWQDVRTITKERDFVSLFSTSGPVCGAREDLLAEMLLQLRSGG